MSEEGNGGGGVLGCLGSVVSMILGLVLIELVFDHFLLLLGVAALGAVAYLGWQVGRSRGAILAPAGPLLYWVAGYPSAWLTLVLWLWLLFDWLERRWRLPRLVASGAGILTVRTTTEPARPVAARLAKSLRDTAACVAIGLGVLVVVQWHVESLDVSREDAVRTAEGALLTWQIWLSELTSPWAVLLLLGLCIVTVCFAPETRAVSAAMGALAWVKRAALVLSVVTGYTLFTSAAHARYDGVWAFAKREEMAQDLAALETWRQHAVSAARIESRIASFSAEERQELARTFTAIARSPEPAARAGNVGHEFGSRAPKVIASESHAAAEPVTGRELAIRRAARWLENPETEPPPSRREAREVRAEAERMRNVWMESRSALLRTLEIGLKAALPTPVSEGLLKPFVDSLVSSSVKESLGAVVPENVRSLGDARRWWRSYARRMEASGDVSEKAWRPAKAAESGKHGGETSQTAPPAPPTPEALLAGVQQSRLLRLRQTMGPVVARSKPWAPAPRPSWGRSPGRSYGGGPIRTGRSGARRGR